MQATNRGVARELAPENRNRKLPDHAAAPHENTMFQSTTPNIVLGMHRSGTSALAGALQGLGVVLGETLYGANEFNPRGYFEDTQIVAFDELLLAQLGSRWDAILPPQEEDFANTRTKVDDGVQLLRKIFSQHTHWGFKDPRMCVLAPFWREVFSQLALSPNLLITVRDPCEVVASLARRDGIGAERAAWMWFAHMRGAMEYVQGAQRSRFVAFSELLERSEPVLESLARWLEIELPQSGIASIAQAVAPDLTHGGQHEGELPKLVATAYALLRDAALAGDRVEDICVDVRWVALCAEFDERERPRLQAVQQFLIGDRQLGVLDRRIEALSQGLTDAQAIVRERFAQYQQLSTQLAATVAAKEAAEEIAVRRLAEMSELRVQLRRTEAAKEEAEKLAVERFGELQDLRARLTSTEEEKWKVEQLAATLQVEVDRIRATRVWRLYSKFEGMRRPVRTSANPLKWSIDGFLLRDRVVFCYGWIFHESAGISSLRLRVRKNGTMLAGAVPVDYGKPRDDVARAFPGRPGARKCGFVTYGSFDQPLDEISEVLLEIRREDGALLFQALPQALIHPSGKHREARKTRRPLFQRMAPVRNGVQLLLHGRIHELTEKIERRLDRARTHVSADIEDVLGPLTSAERADFCVVIDHDLGGGANQYRKGMVQGLIKAGKTVLILTQDVAQLRPVLLMQCARLDLRFAIASDDLLLQLTTRASISQIIYNTGVSFSQPEGIPRLLLDLRERSGARIKVLVHDYFAVCPSHFLLNYEGKYCGVPDTAVCEKCLPVNNQGFATLFVARDISIWRSAWGALLDVAEEIVAFSQDSRTLLTRAYPQLDPHKFSVAPHALENFPTEPLHLDGRGSLRIGVVGHIGFPKGAAVVSALAQEIGRRKSDEKVVIIGSIEAHCDPAIVRETGPYRRENLPRAIRESGANIMLFPSIVPETFSYVVQELMQMQLPVAVFNLGAPAERVRGYAKGLVLSSMEPSTVLEELHAFHQRLYLGQEEAP